MKDYGADQPRLQISELHFDNFPMPATFVCWKIRFKTEECICSQFPTEGNLWIKEVEMVESVHDLKSSRSVKGTPGPDFELLDAKISSALNKINQNNRLKKKISLEGVEAHKEMILSRIMQTYLQLFFEMMIFRNSIRNVTKFFNPRGKSYLMTSWKDCTIKEYESLRNSRSYWNCTTWRFIRRKSDLIVTD